MDPIKSADGISAVDLQAEARRALADGREVLYSRVPYCANPAISVETIIVDGARFGQAVNGDAIWGACDLGRNVLTPDDLDLDGNGYMVELNGREIHRTYTGE
jgi:hypothetical protein